ncbi:putative ribonuclease H-like domain-containing protein [Tanacetum coccineum]
MEAGTNSTILTAKLPILNRGEFNLWLMRIEQYFLMTDYSLREVIKNGNKVLKKTVRETEQEYEPTSTEEKQDKRNDMKDRGILLIALPNKDQLKFHSYKDAKLLMEAIEKSQLEIQGEVITQEDMNLKLLRSLPSEWKTHALIWRNKQEIETISLDDLYNNLKIYEPKISGSASTSQNPQNVAFVSSNSNSSTNEADNTAYEVSATHTQSNPASGDNLKEMDLHLEMAMLTIRARRFIKRTIRKLDVNGQRVGFDRGREINRRTMTVETPTKNALVAQDGIGCSDSEVDSCSKLCVKAYATLKEQYHSFYLDYKRSQFNLVSYKVGLELVEARLAHYKKNEAVFEESLNVLNLEVKLRDNALIENKKKLEKAEKERDELKLTLEKFQNSSKSLNNLLESQVVDKFKTGLGYNAASSTAASPAVESFVNTSEMLENQEHNKSKSDKGYHAVPPPFTGNFIPFKPDLTFMDEIVKSENMDVTTIVTPSNVKVELNHESAGVKSNGDADEPKTVRKNSFRPPIIKDWNSDDESEVEIIPKNKTVSSSTEKIKFVKSGKIYNAGASVNTAVRPVNTAGSKTTMSHPRPISNAYKKGYSQVIRSFNKYSENKNSIFNKKVNTVRVKDTTARDKAVVSENKGKGVNGVKASACCVWKDKNSSALNTFKKYSYIDAREYEDYDGGFVSFGDGKGRISRKRFRDNIVTGQAEKKTEPEQDGGSDKDGDNDQATRSEFERLLQQEKQTVHPNSTNSIKTISTPVSADGPSFTNDDPSSPVNAAENNHSCVACQKGKQHKASCKTKLVNSISKPLHMLHMDLFGPINDETSGILKTFITEIENQLDYKVKVIKSDNGTEFKNSVMNRFCKIKGIKREFSVARTPQQNGIAERRNRTLIEATRTMLVDSKLPTTFWAEVVNTACYVLNRVLVIKPHNKTPYELIHGRTPLIDFMKPFGCPVTILNTNNHLGKFDGKVDEGFFIGYSVVSKAMRVFNKRTRIVEETLNIKFLENTPNVTGNGPDWLFDVDSLIISINYVPVVAGNQSNDPKVSEEDAEEKPTEMDESGASDKDEEADQATRSDTPVSNTGPSCIDDDLSSPVNAAEASNAIKEHLFE